MQTCTPLTATFGVLCVSDCEFFVSEILYDENLSENTQEARKVLLNNFRVVHVRWGVSKSARTRVTSTSRQNHLKSGAAALKAGGEMTPECGDQAPISSLKRLDCVIIIIISSVSRGSGMFVGCFL